MRFFLKFLYCKVGGDVLSMHRYQYEFQYWYESLSGIIMSSSIGIVPILITDILFVDIWYQYIALAKKIEQKWSLTPIVFWHFSKLSK